MSFISELLIGIHLAHVCTFGLELIENKAPSSSMCH